MSEDLLYFEVTSVLGRRIRTTKSYWEKLVTNKHPTMRGKEREVQEALQNAIAVRRSKVDSGVYLYYKPMEGYYICAVTRHLNEEGFLITAYFTKSMKVGGVIWKR